MYMKVSFCCQNVESADFSVLSGEYFPFYFCCSRACRAFSLQFLWHFSGLQLQFILRPLRRIREVSRFVFLSSPELFWSSRYTTFQIFVSASRTSPIVTARWRQKKLVESAKKWNWYTPTYLEIFTSRSRLVSLDEN